MEESAFASMLTAAAVGDGQGFEGLYRWLAPEITRFATIRGAEDPEGVTNEVFLGAFRQITHFNGDSGAFRAWIYAITRNRLIDAHRAASRRPPVADVEVPDQTVGGADVEALDLIGLQRVVRLLGHLSDEQRDVILLRMIGDLSLRQVAAVVDKPVSAVKALQRRGLRRLQNEILTEMVRP
jgi:RNA polymerase sigma-70 factor (ECF subfamily)